MTEEIFDNVFDALCDDPKESANLTARADLIIAIRRRVSEWGLPQKDAALRLGLTRPRLNDLMRGKIDKFSLDALANISEAAGFSLRVQLDGKPVSQAAK